MLNSIFLSSLSHLFSLEYLYVFQDQALHCYPLWCGTFYVLLLRVCSNDFTDSCKYDSSATVATGTTAASVTTDPSAKMPEVKVPVQEENPYGIKAVLEQGDLVAKGTLLILIIMSMASWFVIFSKFFEQSKVKKAAKAVDDKFWTSTNLNDAVSTLHEDSPFRYIAEKGLASAGKHTGLMGGVDLNTWVVWALARDGNRAKSFARWFGSVGNGWFYSAFRRTLWDGLGYL